MRKFLASVAIVFTLAGTAQAQSWNRAIEAYEAGDYATAFQEIKPLAAWGDVGAQYNSLLSTKQSMDESSPRIACVFTPDVLSLLEQSRGRCATLPLVQWPHRAG